MDRLNFYKDFYESEMQKKNELDRSTNIPILAITLLFGLISFLIKAIDFNKIELLDYLILFTSTVIFILMSIAIFRIIISYNNGLKGYEYEVLGSNTDYEKYRKELFEYFEKADDAEKDFKEAIINKLIKSSDNNTKLNIFRTYQLFLAKKFVIISILIYSINFILYLIKQLI